MRKATATRLKNTLFTGESSHNATPPAAAGSEGKAAGADPARMDAGTREGPNTYAWTVRHGGVWGKGLTARPGPLRP